MLPRFVDEVDQLAAQHAAPGELRLPASKGQRAGLPTPPA